MISLEQIQKLEARVHAAVGRIRQLTEENAALSEKLDTYEQRVNELQELVSAFKSDQEAIERGIVAALAHLDELEDSVSEPNASPASQPADTPQPAESRRPAEHSSATDAKSAEEDAASVSVQNATDAASEHERAASRNESAPSVDDDERPETASPANDPTSDDDNEAENDEAEDNAPDEDPELDIF